MHYIPFLTAFVATLVLLWFLRPVAMRFDLVDHPGERKHHPGAVPLVGGIAMSLGYLLAILTLNVPLAPLYPFMGAVLVLLVVGVLDDHRDLSVKSRFAAQIVAGLMMTLGGDVVIHSVGNLVGTGELLLGAFAIPFTVFCVLGAINALNMSDGIDGLAGGLSLVAVLSMAVLTLAHGRGYDARLLILLAAVIVPFLLFNICFLGRRCALVFMGDAGSMILGFAIVWFLVSISQGEYAAMRPVTALWIFAVPIIDTVSIMIRRMMKGQSPFQPDREHLHHIFMVAGFSSNQTLAIILAIAALLAFIGVSADLADVPESYLTWSFLVLGFMHLYGMRHAWRLMKRVRKLAHH